MTPAPEPRPETAALDRADRLGAFALFALLLALYTLTFSGLPDNPDAEVEFQTARSLYRHGSFALADTPEARAIAAAEFDVAPGGPGREDRWYAWFGVGQAFAALPFYAAGGLLERVWPEVEARHAESSDYGARRSEYWRHLAVGWRNPLLAAATAALIALAARRLGASRASALSAALAFGVATFAWAQARSTLSDVQTSFCLAFAFERWLALRARAEPTGWILAAAGSSLALAFLTRVAIAPAALAVAAAVALELRARRARARDWACLATPLALGFALFCVCNRLRFGSLLETGYGAVLSEGTFFSYPPHLGLAGILVAPGKGLVWLAPLFLLAPAGWRAARARGERAWPWLCAAVALAVVLPVACTQTWHGAWTYGPRYVLPLLPLCWPAVALALDRARERARLRLAAVALAALGLATSLPAVLVDHMTHQDLAVQAARVAWPYPGGRDERERDAARFLSIQWSWSFAAPWAHWRIALHRALGGGDEYSPRELFGADSDASIRPQHDRELDGRHFAWVDLRQRLGGPAWLGLAASGAWLALAAAAWALGRARGPGGGPGPASAQGSPRSPR